ncbi:MAG: hypothetical protein KJ614_00270 [Gammaproteobacteria bacterium]|uniref:FitA-like ribbon-helix-helix domain-containing protein n=1 Tax=Rhodoferax sp. TaxID=50421 RepID=UPI00180602EB|nr:hypothetical protein [Rhodoferax sp.]MBU3897359.1 hypothetical protein [Gammaproteobacteria bacterium]MBA3058823.1 hypothetical protein [Rhodoferax sp.]MBU3999238.1 hypothetical protein [Gammaproteobacteria bacterium]MBU4018705.1 hypothetical protein [Gammaproteobacteria bacterium]MBU4079660.1 hypothetical protein [Gammaproteobacteria bacterium]
MPNLSVKDVPEAWAQALRERAARNHRSLQGELMALIQRAVESQAGSPSNDAATAEPDNNAPFVPMNPLATTQRQRTVVGLDRFGKPIIRQGWKTVEQVVAELRETPHDTKLCHALPRGVDIIREERDAR